MREIEVKILDIDVDDIKHRLDKAGAVYLGERLIQEKAFDFPDQRIRASNSLCRLRKIGNAIEFAFKGNREKNAQFQIAEETEVVVSDFEKTEKILVSLGLSAYRDREKRRISYMLA
ncbi:MAG: CYTH domain-containing protein, partial [Patescibacteria group bacterium]